MPNAIFTISGTVYDTSLTAVTSSPTIILENMTTHETTTASCNSSGVYQIEGANLTSGLTANDWISISVVSSKNMYGEIIAKISAANLVTGFWDTANIYMRNGTKHIAHGSSYAVQSVVCNNLSSALFNIWMLDRTQTSGIPFRVVMVVAVKPNTSVPITSFRAIRFDGGVRVIQVPDILGNTPNKMTAGIANAIGDIGPDGVEVTIVA